MFVGGLITQSSRLEAHAGKTLAADVSIAVTLFVLGLLMMIGVLPGAAYGAIPSSAAFILMTASVVIGALYIMSRRNPFQPREKSLKEINEQLRNELEEVSKGSVDLENTRALLEEVTKKLGEESLTAFEREKLKKIKSRCEGILGIE